MDNYSEELERMKTMIREEANNVIEMLDDVDDPPALDYQIKKCGIRVRIVVDLYT